MCWYGIKKLTGRKERTGHSQAQKRRPRRDRNGT
jgi:hypothetical protein